VRNPRFGIFTGTFTVKWRAAAAVTSRVMTGTLYGAYYDLPPESQWIAWAVSAVQHGRETAPDLAGQCAERALGAGTSGNPVGRNDGVLEQSQIVITHNLATLADGTSLTSCARGHQNWPGRPWSGCTTAQPANDWPACRADPG
jgi:hypothetical protein